jgi:hypothetical protein
METAGQKLDSTVSTTTGVTSTFTQDADPARQRVAIKYQRVAMDMAALGQKMSFDSSQPEAADPLGIGKALGGVVGKEVRLVLDAQGKVVEVENLDEITKSLAVGNPMVAQMVASMFNKETVSQVFEQSALKSVPGKPVKPGEKWAFNKNIELPQLGSVGMKGTYTYKRPAERDGVKCLEITQDSTLTMNMDQLGAGTEQAAAIKEFGMKIENGVMKGTIWFDPALGTARAAEMKQTMTIRMKDPAKPDKQMSVPMNQTVTITLTKVEDAP